MKNLILFLLLICSAVSSAQTVDFEVKEDGEGKFIFTVITVEPNGDWTEVNKVDLDSAQVRTYVNRQLGIFKPAYTTAELEASDAKRTLKSLESLYDDFYENSLESELTKFETKFDGIWRLRFGKEKYEVEIFDGKMRDDKKKGYVKIVNERVLEVNNFFAFKDFNLFEVEEGVLAGEVDGEKIVLIYKGKIEEKGKSDGKKN